MINVLMNEAEFYHLYSPCIYEYLPNVVELTNSNSCTSLSAMSKLSLLSPVRNRSLRSSTIVKSWNHLSSNDFISPKRNSKPRYATGKTLNDYPERLEEPLDKHCRVSSTEKTKTGGNKLKHVSKARIYFSLLFASKKRGDNCKPLENWNKEVKRTEFWCSKCKHFLCKKHFNIFHRKF